MQNVKSRDTRGEDDLQVWGLHQGKPGIRSEYASKIGLTGDMNSILLVIKIGLTSNIKSSVLYFSSTYTKRKLTPPGLGRL